MRVVLILVGALGALYAVVGVLQLIKHITAYDAANANATGMIAAAVVPPIIGLLVAVVCWKKVFSGSPPRQ